jgi:D-isomer specific 2-hydroxyacid dehydrogenase, catalytic domain/D-isomer specific 2-hydroxyacid dehydrogenase, NAD binding domain
MKVAVFSTKKYDREFLDAANQSRHQLIFLEHRLSTETASLAADSEGVCVFVNDHLDAETIATLAKSGTRLISLRCAGYNNVDLKAAAKHGITVVRVPGYSPYAVAEHTIGLILALNRKLHRAYNRVREGNFALDGLLDFDLQGRTIGIIGTGKIGSVVTQILTGFGCPTLAFDPIPNETCRSLGIRYVNLDELFARVALPAYAREQAYDRCEGTRENEKWRHAYQYQPWRVDRYGGGNRSAQKRQDRLSRSRCLRGRRANLFRGSLRPDHSGRCLREVAHFPKRNYHGPSGFFHARGIEEHCCHNHRKHHKI